jgi:hypothetical protein
MSKAQMDRSPRSTDLRRGLTGKVRRLARTAGTALLPLTISALLAPGAFAQTPDDLKKEVDLLREQNRLLQEQVKSQQQTLERVNERMSDLEHKLEDRTSAGEGEPNEARKKGFSLKNVIISGEGGIAYFNGQHDAQFSHNVFRVDEARLFVESPIIENVYFYSELNLTTRETPDENFHLGELYLDFENLSRFWHQDNQLTLRIGRFYTPFGEEYQQRYAINNPLISHSLSDIWGVDEGLEIFGTLQNFSYALAVQNGGIESLNDATDDKTVAGRIGFDPTSKWHFSASAMRTGDIKNSEFLSALWFGNGFFMPLPGSPATRFNADLYEGDAQYKWRSGYLKGAGGYANFSDNASNHRDIYYYYGEGVQHFSKRWYAAARFSQILARHGYPIVGNATFDDYMGVLTDDIWRLSLGIGWRYNEHFLLKADYSFERGREQNGTARHHEDMFGAEAAFQF